MSAFRTALVAALLILAAAVPAQNQPTQEAVSATPWVEVHASQVRLIAGQAKVASDRYLAGLEIMLADGWKTYWRMPGDSGVPPTFDWAGSTNVAAVNVLYPAPVRMPEAGGEAIGYKKSALLPIEITSQDPAKPVILKLALEFGVCREICIPATATFDLSIPTGPIGAPTPEIAAAIERVPRPQQSRRKDDPQIKRVAVSRDGPSPRLTIEAVFHGGAKGADVFVEAPEGLYIPLPRRLAANADGLVRFESELSRDLVRELKGKTLTLTLVSEAGATEAQWAFP